MSKQIKETDLYLPVKDFFEAKGYDTRGEVKDCDMAGLKDDELIIIELKLRMNITLLYQVIDRQKIADKTYIAIPKLSFRQRKYLSKIKYICESLNIGFMTVDLKENTVDLHFDPEYPIRLRDNKKKRAIIDEINNRRTDLNQGGTNGKIITAFRENSILVSVIIEKEDSISPKRMREFGFSENQIRSILRQNYYKWFEREKRGVYILSEKGKKEIHGEFKDAREVYENVYYKKLEEMIKKDN